jgi:hypothetical protein
LRIISSRVPSALVAGSSPRKPGSLLGLFLTVLLRAKLEAIGSLKLAHVSHRSHSCLFSTATLEKPA